MALAFGYRDHLTAHVAHALHVRAAPEVGDLVAEFAAPLATFGVVGAPDFQPANLHLHRIVRERPFAHVQPAHGTFALGGSHHGPDTFGAEPVTARIPLRKDPFFVPERNERLPVSACRLNWIPEDLKTDGTTKIFRRFFQENLVML